MFFIPALFMNCSIFWPGSCEFGNLLAGARAVPRYKKDKVSQFNFCEVLFTIFLTRVTEEHMTRKQFLFFWLLPLLSNAFKK